METIAPRPRAPKIHSISFILALLLFCRSRGRRTWVVVGETRLESPPGQPSWKNSGFIDRKTPRKERVPGCVVIAAAQRLVIIRCYFPIKYETKKMPRLLRGI